MMLNFVKLRITQHKSLLIAACISMALHLLLLGNHSISLPADFENISTIHVRLIKSLPTQQLSMSDTKARQLRPTPSTPAKPALSERNALEETEARTMPTTAIEQHSNTATPNVASDADALPETDKTELIAENDHHIATTEPAEQSNTHVTTAYPYVQTEFDVSRGEDSGILGNTQMTFFMNPRNHTYQLTSKTEPKGVASLFLSKLEQYSEGNVDEQGLKPNYYAYQYGTNSDKNQYAKLSWSDGIIEMTSKKGKKSEALPEGTQDFLSFMYQFMFTPPLNVMQITMTNGKYLRTYTYSFEGEETITTKLGDLKTLHLLKSTDSLEKTEIWLALDYQNIPVKIRKTEKDGSVIEQIVTAISTTRPE